MEHTGKYAALYCRLSKDDALQEGDSNSIENQKAFLQSYATENGYNHTKVFIDDGYSGTTADRPEFQNMISAVEAGLISVIIVKDLSRFGSNYLMVGYYVEDYFPQHHVRFIAVNDNVDSITGMGRWRNRS